MPQLNPTGTDSGDGCGNCLCSWVLEAGKAGQPQTLASSHRLIYISYSLFSNISFLSAAAALVDNAVPALNLSALQHGLDSGSEDSSQHQQDEQDQEAAADSPMAEATDLIASLLLQAGQAAQGEAFEEELLQFESDWELDGYAACMAAFCRELGPRQVTAAELCHGVVRAGDLLQQQEDHVEAVAALNDLLVELQGA